MNNQYDRLWYLVSLKLSGEANDAEIAELNALLQQYPEAGLRIDIIEKVWKKRPATETGWETGFNKHLQRLSNHLSEPALQYESVEPIPEPTPQPPVRSLRKRILWATAIAASILAVVVFTYSNKTNITAPNSVSTKMGSKSKIQLPDGTQVWLNADSKITYNENFNSGYREVELTGEAYFDVVKDKARPFIIHTKTIDIKVLGTAFNVRSYPNDKATETALIHGSVEITVKNNPDKKFVLKPNEKLLVQHVEAPVTKVENKRSDAVAPIITWAPLRSLDKKDSLTYETSWVRNYLSFDEETLEQVIKKIERWYDVQVNLDGDISQQASSTYSGVFEDEDLAVVMEALKMAGSFNYTIKKKEVTIRP